MISSQAGLRGGAQWSVYSAAKAGVLRLVESLAQELAPPPRIRVNAVCPGKRPRLLLSDERGPRSSRSRPPRGEPIEENPRPAYVAGDSAGDVFAEPGEVAFGVRSFLASAMASYVTGTRDRRSTAASFS